MTRAEFMMRWAIQNPTLSVEMADVQWVAVQKQLDYTNAKAEWRWVAESTYELMLGSLEFIISPSASVRRVANETDPGIGWYGTVKITGALFEFIEEDMPEAPLEQAKQRLLVMAKDWLRHNLRALPKMVD